MFVWITFLICSVVMANTDLSVLYSRQMQLQENVSTKTDARTSNTKNSSREPMTPTSPWFSKELNRGQYGGRNLAVGGLTANDRHGSVQVVSSTNGDVAIDNPTVGLSDTLIAANPDVEVVSETK